MSGHPGERAGEDGGRTRGAAARLSPALPVRLRCRRATGEGGGVRSHALPLRRGAQSACLSAIRQFVPVFPSPYGDYYPLNFSSFITAGSAAA